MSCFRTIDCYDELILPFLYRLSNLETLNLSLSISVKEIFIDGHNLRNKIVNHLSRLSKFTFDIHSIMNINHDIILPSNEDIRNTFKDFQYTQMMCYMDHFLDRKKYRYRDVAQFHNSGIIAKILELLELTYLYITYNSVIHKRILSSGETFQLNENHMKYH